MTTEFPRVTPRQHEVWRRVAEAQPSKQIAYELGISQRTVDHTREALYRILRCNSGVQCARLPIRWGVVREPVLRSQFNAAGEKRAHRAIARGWTRIDNDPTGKIIGLPPYAKSPMHLEEIP